MRQISLAALVLPFVLSHAHNQPLYAAHHPARAISHPHPREHIGIADQYGRRAAPGKDDDDDSDSLTGLIESDTSDVSLPFPNIT